MSTKIIFVLLFILSEPVFALLGARAAFQSRGRDSKKRTIVGMSVGCALFLYAVAAALSFWNSLHNAANISTCLSIEYQLHALWISFLRAFAIAALAFTFMQNSQVDPGFIRSKWNNLLSKFQ